MIIKTQKVRHQRLLHSERGAEFIEYALALGLLIGIFVAMSLYLRRSADNRANESINIIKDMAPCGGTGQLNLNSSSNECL